MDLVNYDEAIYDQIVENYKAFSSKLEVSDIQFVPISALAGDNVVNRSEKTTWYQGATLMHMLETVHIESDYNHIDSRFPVQYVVRPQSAEYHDFRGYAGRVAGGIFRPGDEVVVLPSGFTSTICQAGGPPYQMYVLAQKLPKMTYVGTSAQLARARPDAHCAPPAHTRPAPAVRQTSAIFWFPTTPGWTPSLATVPGGWSKSGPGATAPAIASATSRREP
jgi:sulfate adenylyltransferase subunit 1 (EFTu-like GTPase family)